MKANSRNSIRWGLATAVVALALGALTLSFDDDGGAIIGKAALADGGGNGRLVTVKLETLGDDSATSGEEKKPPASQRAADADEGPTSAADQSLGNGDDGDLIRDDSDVASVDGTANDGDAVDNAADSVATATKGTADTINGFFGGTF